MIINKNNRGISKYRKIEIAHKHSLGVVSKALVERVRLNGDLGLATLAEDILSVDTGVVGDMISKEIDQARRSNTSEISDAMRSRVQFILKKIEILIYNAIVGCRTEADVNDKLKDNDVIQNTVDGFVEISTPDDLIENLLTGIKARIDKAKARYIDAKKQKEKDDTKLDDEDGPDDENKDKDTDKDKTDDDNKKDKDKTGQTESYTRIGIRNRYGNKISVSERRIIDNIKRFNESLEGSVTHADIELLRKSLHVSEYIECIVNNGLVI